MKHKLSASILIPSLAGYTVQLKYGLKCIFVNASPRTNGAQAKALN